MTTRRRVAAVALASLLVFAGCSTLSQPLGSDAATEGIRFENATESAGIDYHATGTGSGNGNSGVYATDIDNDGWTDLLIIGGESPALFVNRGGEFERRAAFPNVTADVKSAAVVDYDGDGWDDIVFFRVEDEPVVLHNEGGEFARTDIGLGNLTYPLGATAGDYDGDGDSDLFVYQSGRWAEHKPAGYSNVSEQVGDDNGNPNVLYENTGEGFERVTDTGIDGRHWSLAASFVDLTGDGNPDIHVANDYNNDTLYVNQGDGSFERRTLGPATDRNGMSSEVGFVTDDDRADLFVTNIYVPMNTAREALSEEEFAIVSDFVYYRLGKRAKGNSLLVSRANGTLDDQAAALGVQEGGWGWAASFADFDNDGDQDLFHTTQTFVRIHDDDPVWPLPMVFERDGEGFERRDAADVGFAETDGRGTAVLDYDRDGDLDLVVAQYDGGFRLYENVGGDPVAEGDRDGAGTNALQLRLKSSEDGPALGARVTVTVDGETTHRVVNARSDFRSQDTRMVHLGLGDATAVEEVRITWADGSERVLTDVPANRTVTVTRGGPVTVAGFTGPVKTTE
jgi:hypothetical protein